MYGVPSSTAPSNQKDVELEGQFILRLPEEPAAALREAVKSGTSNIKERLRIQMEPDIKEHASLSVNAQMRRGRVIFDGWTMSAKMVDLPTIIESMKTIDKKTFYKSADISQILICREGETSSEDEEPEQTSKDKQKDPNKVDKKYIFNHGICPPLKNCRKRRFRKTLKKKNVEAPEIEKEVKRLLRQDCEAERIKYELITEEEYRSQGGKEEVPSTSTSATKDKDNKTPKKDKKNKDGASTKADNTTTNEMDDLFGAVSDSESDSDLSAEESSPMRRNLTGKDLPEEEDSLQSAAATAAAERLPTQFSKEMFVSPKSKAEESASGGSGAVTTKLTALKAEISDLTKQKMELQKNIANSNNQALLMRFQESLKEIERKISDKEIEVESLSMF